MAKIRGWLETPNQFRRRGVRTKKRRKRQEEEQKRKKLELEQKQREELGYVAQEFWW